MFFHLAVLRIYLLSHNKTVLLPQPGKHHILSPHFCKMVLVSTIRNNREPSFKTQAGMELCKDLSYVVMENLDEKGKQLKKLLGEVADRQTWWGGSYP